MELPCMDLTSIQHTTIQEAQEVWEDHGVPVQMFKGWFSTAKLKEVLKPLKLLTSQDDLPNVLISLRSIKKGR